MIFNIYIYTYMQMNCIMNLFQCKEKNERISLVVTKLNYYISVI